MATEPDPLVKPLPGRLLLGGMDLYESQKTSEGRVINSPQIDAVDATYDLVFLTIGGNDLDFAPVAMDCF